VSLKVLVLASWLPIVALFRAGGFYPRIALASAPDAVFPEGSALGGKVLLGYPTLDPLAVPVAHPAIKRVDLFIYML
jgi:hypothetical protein